MRRQDKEFKKANFTLDNFIGDTIRLLGIINLQVILGEGCKILAIDVLFVVIDASASYNAILG